MAVDVNEDFEMHGAFSVKMVATVVDVLGPGTAFDVDQNIHCKAN